MQYEATGVLEKIFDTQQVTEKFSKREIVLEIKNGEYSELIKFQLVQDNCAIIDPYTEGEEVKIHFNLKGRKWSKDGKDSYFTNLEAWRIERVGEATPKQSDNIPPEDDDEMPF